MRAGGKRGITLIEVTLTLTLMSVIGGVYLLATQTLSSAMRTGVVVAETNGQAQRVLDRICEDLKCSSSDLTTPQPIAPFSGTAVDYQRAVGIDANGDPQWGPPERFELEYEESDDGVDNDGDGLIDECRILWTENPGLANDRRVVVSNGVREYLEGETFDGKDENGNGLLDEQGFSLDFDSGRLTVRVSLEDRDKQGYPIVTTVQRTVAFRNEGD
jgi:hypothetical protein